MKITACPDCHTQYDVTNYGGDSLECPCGTTVQKALLTSRAAEIHRCGSCGAAVTAQESHCTYCSSKIERESTLFTLICPECFARNSEVAIFCADCGVRFEPQEPPIEENLHACPVCEDAPMEARVIAGLMLQECTQCRGLWIPDDRLDRLVDQAVQAAGRRGGPPAGKPAATRSMGPVVYRKCPVCSDAMQRKNFARRSGVILDWCGHHGTWLDADELEAIAAYVVNAGVGHGVPDEWRMNSTEKRFKAIAAEHLPEFSNQENTQPGRGHGTSVFSSMGLVNGEDVVEGFVDWLSDLLGSD